MKMDMRGPQTRTLGRSDPVLEDTGDKCVSPGYDDIGARISAKKTRMFGARSGHSKV
jgi:hypothetical protein